MEAVGSMNVFGYSEFAIISTLIFASEKDYPVKDPPLHKFDPN
jgi:hypothetical protein